MLKVLTAGIHEIIQLLGNEGSLGLLIEALRNLMINGSKNKEVREAFATNIDSIILSYAKEQDVKLLIENIQNGYNTQ